MIYPSQIEMFLRRQGWRHLNNAETNAIEDPGLRDQVRFFPHRNLTYPDPDNSRCQWIICLTPITDPNWRQRYQETIDRLSHIYCCQTWELECVLRCEPFADTHNEILEFYDQMTGLDPIESPDHQPVKIRCNKDGANKLMAALISHRYGWGSTVQAIGRDGGVFDLTIEDIA